MKQPIYKEIMIKIKKKIEKLPPNVPITSERELAILFNTSRMTIRKSIDSLVDEGYLYRDGKKGTFVSDEKFHKTNTSLDFLQENSESIMHNIIYFCRKDNICEKDILLNLNISEDENIIRIVKKNFIRANNIEKVKDIEEIYIVCKRISKNIDFTQKEFVNFKQFIESGKISQKFIPMILPIKYTSIMGVAMDTPIILTETVIFDKKALPIVFIKTYNNPIEKEIMIIT